MNPQTVKIKEIREISVPLSGAVRNAVVNFETHTVSLVAVISDVIRNGKPVTGVAFNSIGRFAQGGLISERLSPRVLNANPEDYYDQNSSVLDPAKVADIAMRDEKPGGHGDRASAVAAIELACWDLISKIAHEPAHITIARIFGRKPSSSGVPVYAAGGYYYPGKDIIGLTEELQRYCDAGFGAAKIKIGRAPLSTDMKRVEAAIKVMGTPANIAVDANGVFNMETARPYARELSSLGLRWLEEMGDPLDYAMMAELSSEFDCPFATGENLFSIGDVRNLLKYSGMRPGKDIFQMDAGLSYGLNTYAGMIKKVEADGHNRSQILPHGGHMINLHIVTALGLGGCEAYPDVFQPFGGYTPECRVENGNVWPSEAPGFGLEQKQELKPYLQELRI